jgi:hypothetical protein
VARAAVRGRAAGVVKTLDGLMRYLMLRLSGAEYMAMVRRASWEYGMTLREYVANAFEQWKPPARRKT